MVDFTDPGTVGLTLVSLGVILFLVEAAVPGFFIAVPGTILLILGVVAYNTPADSFDSFLKFAPVIIVLVGGPATGVTIWLYRKFAPPGEAPTTRSADSLVGQFGTVTRAVDSESIKGKVRLGREIWSATTDGGVIETGVRVRVARVEGVAVTVEPTTPPAPETTQPETG